MTQAMLNTKLYQKMYAEQELFKAELMLLSPVEVLDKADEYVCQEDIQMSLRKGDGWEESHHMENIWNAIEARANEVVRADFIEARRDAR